MTELSQALIAAKYVKSAYSGSEGFLNAIREEGLYDPQTDFVYDMTVAGEVEAHCHYCARTNQMIVAVAGTNGAGDFMRDIWIGFKKWAGYRGHPGFVDAAQELLVKLIPIMANHRDQKPELILCGHSLGGAICQWLQAAAAGEVRTCYTFGSPRAMTRGSARKFHLMHGFDHLRFVNGADFVPRALGLLYSHVGRLFFIRPDGQIVTGKDATRADNGMWWRSLSSLGRRGVSRHGIQAYLDRLSDSLK